MSYMLANRKLDIGGPKGNVFSVIGIATNLVKQVEGREESEVFSKECFELNSYEDVLKKVVDKTGITLVSGHALPYPSELYSLEEDVYL